MKDNIMKMTDGLFHKVFDEIAAQYPDIEKEAWIVDIGAAKMADTPEAFDVIVMPNLYGDILSRRGGADRRLGRAWPGSANVGDKCAMFEAIHGSAPRRAGQNLANPSGLLLGAVLMLVHIDQPEAADARPQRLAAHHRGRHPHVRHLHRGRQHAEGRHQGIRVRGDRADRAEAEHAEAGDLRQAAGGSGGGRRRDGQLGRDGTEGHRRLRLLALAQSECAGRGGRQSWRATGSACR